MDSILRDYALRSLLGVTAALAALVPAVRATRTDPLVAIRHE